MDEGGTLRKREKEERKKSTEQWKRYEERTEGKIDGREGRNERVMEKKRGKTEKKNKGRKRSQEA